MQTRSRTRPVDVFVNNFPPMFTHCYFVAPRVRTKSKSKSLHVNWLRNERFSSCATLLLSHTIWWERGGSRCERWRVNHFVYDFRVGWIFFSNFKPNNPQNKVETIDVCGGPISSSTDEIQCYYPHITRCEIGRTDTFCFFLCIFSIFFFSPLRSNRSAAGCCANLWDHRENDFASFSIGFFNHRSSINVFTRTRWNKAHMVKCWQAATGRTIKW